MSRQGGFTLVETLVALVILGIALTGILPAFTSHTRVNARSQQRSGAIVAAQQVLESLRLDDPAAMPEAGSTAPQLVLVGDVPYEVITHYCENESLCDDASRHLTVEVQLDGKRSMTCRRSIHGCTERSRRARAAGFSLLELLVSMTVMLAISGAALSLSLSSRRLYEADEARTRLNQSLRAGLDLIGTDVRQAGERLPDDFPALEIINGGDGASDIVVVRRNLIDTVLPVCEDVAGSAQKVHVQQAGVLGCEPLPDANGDGWSDNIETWHEWRVDHGGTVRAYIYSPVKRLGEFFSYVDDDPTHPYLERDGGEWVNNYEAEDQCRLYVLEERRYLLSEGLLHMIVDGEPDAPLNVVDGIVDFQVLARFSDGTEQETLGPADLWSDLRSIEIALAGETELRGQPIQRRISTDFFPRNVLSR